MPGVKNWPVLALAAALLLLMAAAACGPRDDMPAPAANPTAAPSPTVEPTAAATPAATIATPVATPAPSPTAEPTAAAAAAAIPAATTAAPIPTDTPAPTATQAAPAATPAAATASTLLQLVDPLDEPEFYCVDVPGFRDSLRTDRPLQAHTCKPGTEDELFVANQPGAGQFRMPAYDLCITAEGNQVYTRPCTDTPAQRFSHQDDLTLRTAEGDLCLAVADGNGEPAGGRSHLRRDLQLLPCSQAEPALSQWVMPGRRPQS